jgi:amino acid transporter
MFSWMVTDVLGSSRMIFAVARDGMLPAWLGWLGPRSQVPVRAILIYAAAGALLASVGSFLELIFLSSLATVAIYLMGCGAAVVLSRRGTAEAGPPLRFAGLPAAAAVGCIGMIGMILAASWQEVAGLAGLIAASLVLYFATARRG